MKLKVKYKLLILVSAVVLFSIGLISVIFIGIARGQTKLLNYDLIKYQTKLNAIAIEKDFEESYNDNRDTGNISQYISTLTIYKANLYSLVRIGGDYIYSYKKEAINANDQYKVPDKVWESVSVGEVGAFVYGDTYKTYAQVSGTDLILECDVHEDYIFELSNKTIIVAVGISLAMIGLSIFVGVLMIGVIVKPIKKSSDLIEEIASGDADLTKRIVSKSNYKDEIYDFGISFNKFISSLQVIVLTVKESMGKLSEINQEFVSNIEETSAGVIQMNSNVMSAVKGVENQNKSVEEVNKNIIKMKQLIESLLADIKEQYSFVTEGSASIEQVVKNIQYITSVTNKTIIENKEMLDNFELIKKEVVDTRNSVNDISNQRNTLDSVNTLLLGIANKINILGINASIEAARAGESGRGFSVVADEVRKLGEMVQDQTKETESLLHSIDTSITGLNGNMSRATTLFHKFSESVLKVSTVIEEINQGMVEQDLGGKDIIKALDNIKSTTAQVNDKTSTINGSMQVIVVNSKALTEATEELLENFKEMELGIRESNLAIQSISDKTIQLSDTIKIVDSEMEKFK